MRLVTVTAPFEIRGAQLISETGVCATSLNVTAAGESLNLGCITDPGTYAELLQFTLANDYGRAAEAIAAWPSTCQMVMYYEADGTLDDTMLFYSGSATQYSTLWAELTRRITVDHTFPYNQPLRDAYVASGATSADLDLDDPGDQEYLRNLWYALLAPRRCSADWQCKAFLRHGEPECVFDALGYRAWRNGDLPGAGVTGDEGGCEPDPGWDRLQFGQSCLEGLGPASGDEWRLAVQYQAALELATGIDQPVFDEDELPPDGPLSDILCRLPTYVSTLPTAICGGRGKVTLVTYEVAEEVHYWPDANGHLLTPACTGLLINGTLLRNANDSIAIQRFVSDDLLATVIADSLWLRQGLVYVPAGDAVFTCLNDVAERLLDYGARFTKLYAY